MLDIVELMVMAFHGTNPDSVTGKLVARGEIQQRTAGMIDALRLLQRALKEESDAHTEPSEAIGMLIARHENARSGGGEGDVTL